MLANVEIPHHVQKVLQKIKQAGHEAFLVGGCVRDMVMGRVPADYDICTAAAPDEVMALFECVVPTGIRFGTVTVIEDDLPVEVTLYRGVTAAEDVGRRDFTVNGLLYDGQEVIDYVGGRADIERGVMRAIGAPALRLQEDPLRMLRAVRLAGQLGFAVEAETARAIRENAVLIANVAEERVREELKKMLLLVKPSECFIALQELGLLAYVLPELDKCAGFLQHSRHHQQDVFGHTMTVLDLTEPVLALRLAALLHDIGKPETFSQEESGEGHFYGHQLIGSEIAKAVLRRLKFDIFTTEAVIPLVREHMTRYDNTSPKALKRLIGRVGRDNMGLLIKLMEADAGSGPRREVRKARLAEFAQAVEAVLAAQEPFSRADLAVNGGDLLELGIPAGPAVGRVLDALLELVLDDPAANERELLLEKARGIYGAIVLENQT